jgi:hypothetical protein
MSYPFAVFYTPYCLFISSTIYQTKYFQRHLHFSNSFKASTANITCLFAGLGKSLNNTSNYDGGGTMLLISESTRPSPTHPHPAFAFPIVFSSYKLHPTPPLSSSLSLLGIRPSSNSSSNANRMLFLSSVGVGRIAPLAPVRRLALEFIVYRSMLFWLGGVRVGDNEDGGDARGGRLAA